MNLSERRVEGLLAAMTAVAVLVSAACIGPVSPQPMCSGGSCPVVTFVVNGVGSLSLTGPAGSRGLGTNVITLLPLDTGDYVITGNMRDTMLVSVRTGIGGGGVVPSSFLPVSGTYDSLSVTGPCIVRYRPAPGASLPVPIRLQFRVGPTTPAC